MNLRSAIRSHTAETLRLSRMGRDKAARAHALRANQLKTVQQIKRELRQEKQQ